MQRVFKRRERQHRRAPRAAPDRYVEDDSERDVERRDVLDVVVVLRWELPKRVVERTRREEHERAEQQVVRGGDEQDRPQPRLVHLTTTFTSLPGTTTVFTTACPFRCALIFGDSSASRSSSSRGVSGATVSRSRILPFT